MKTWMTALLGWFSSLALAGVYLLIGDGIDQVISGENITIVPLAAFLTILTGVFAGTANFIGGRLIPRFESQLRRRVVAQVFSLGAYERTKERAGRIVNTATDGVERSATYKAIFKGPMIASLATPTLVLVLIAIVLDPLSALFMLIAVPLVPLSMVAFQRAFKSVSQRYRASSRALAAQELDAIQGLSALVLMNAGEAMGAKLAEATEDVRRKVMRYLAGNQLVLLVVDSVFSLGMITGAALLAVWRYEAGAITVGEGFSLLLLSSIMLDPLDRIGQFFYIGMGGIAATREIGKFCAEEPAVTDAPDAAIPPHVPSAGTIELDNVHFAYQDSSPLLEGVNFRVDAYEHLVLTGASGSGKSTISALIQGSRRPTRGTVRLSGVDIASTPLAWVRSRIATVEQTTYLFSSTLRHNLLIARPDATDKDLEEALHAAHLDELLERLPQGLDTPIGPRAHSLSGGEAQRVALARAFLKRAPNLLLDEPTAHVDLASEREILEALRGMSHDQTTLTISHRAATIKNADRQVELANGVIQ